MVGLDNTPAFYLDDTGHEINVFRDSELRSQRELVRALVAVSGSNLFLRTASGLAIEAVRGASAVTAADIINAVRDAIVTGTSADLGSQTASASTTPATSLKAVFNAISVVLSDGTVALDNVGGTNSTNLFRPLTSRSARQNFRRLMLLNGDVTTLRLNTFSGVITRQIEIDQPANVVSFLNSIETALADTTSTSATALAAVPSIARATSMLEQLQQLVVTASDGTIALDDTGEGSLTRTNQKRSLLTVAKSFVQPRGDTEETFKLQTTSGKKWLKVAAINPATGSVSDIVTALVKVKKCQLEEK